MIGKIRKMSNGSDYTFPVTVSDAVYVDMKTNLTEKLKQFTPTNTYKLDTTEKLKWNIYDDGTHSVETTSGINNALVWARDNGYNHVVLTAGTYLVTITPDWQNNAAIYMVSGMHFEMEKGCVIQLESCSADAYEVIYCNGIENSKISGGKIIGDKLDHQFNIWVNGWVRGGVNADGTFNNDPTKIRSSVIDKYAHPRMLNNWRLWKISTPSSLSPLTSFSFYQWKDTVNSIDTYIGMKSDGTLTTGANSGRGWITNPITTCNKMVIVMDISTLNPAPTDSDIASLSVMLDTSYATHESGIGIFITDCKHIEVDGVDLCNLTGDGIMTGYITGDPSNYSEDYFGGFVWIHGCNIHNNRRQGISLLGTNDVFVYDNYIHDIGYADDGVTRGKTHFTGPGYGIDIESMVSGTNIPYESLFYGKRGFEINYRLYIFRNHFRHNAGGHLNNPDGSHITIEENIFEGGNLITWDKNRFIRFIKNKFLSADTEKSNGFGAKVYNIGQVYAVNDYALPTIRNGIVYQCTTASGNATITEPIWNSLDSSTTTDDAGNVWKAIQAYCQLTCMEDNYLEGNYFENSKLLCQNARGMVVVDTYLKNSQFSVSDSYNYFGMVTNVDLSTGTFTVSNIDSGMGIGARVCFEAWYGKIPTGIDPEVLYYVVGLNTSAKTLQVSATPNGSPVIPTDIGTTGFHVSRHNYGKILVDGIYAECDWNDKNSVNPYGIGINGAGGVFRNIFAKNLYSVSITGQGSPKYVGRPNVVENVTVVEGCLTLESCHASNIKVMRVKAEKLGGGVVLGNSSLVNGVSYGKAYIDNATFQGVGINISNVVINRGTFIGGYSQAVNSSFGIITNSYFENHKLNMSSITNPNITTIAKSIFNNLTINAPYTKFYGNTDLNSATAGFVNNNAWNSGSTYGVNAIVNNGSNVYQCTAIGGGVSTSQPTGTSNTSVSYADGYSWLYLGILANFNS